MCKQHGGICLSKDHLLNLPFGQWSSFSTALWLQQSFKDLIEFNFLLYFPQLYMAALLTVWETVVSSSDLKKTPLSTLSKAGSYPHLSKSVPTPWVLSLLISHPSSPERNSMTFWFICPHQNPGEHSVAQKPFMNRSENTPYVKIQEVITGIVEILKSNHRIIISPDLVITENEREKSKTQILT